MKHYEKEAQILLRKLGVNGTYTGFRYMVYGISKTIYEPELIIYICKGLYIDISTHFHVNVSNVERNIRTIINIIWQYGNKKLLDEIFGRELTEKPKNAMFIDALSQYILDCYKEQEHTV